MYCNISKKFNFLIGMSDPIIFDDDDNEDNTSKKSDFMKMGGSVIKSINIKMAFFLFILGMLLFSDLFISSVLSKFNDSVQGECTTTKGTFIQLLFLCLGYIILDLITKAGWI